MFLNGQGRLRNAFPWRPCKEVFIRLPLEQFCPEALDQMTYLGSFQSAAYVMSWCPIPLHRATSPSHTLGVIPALEIPGSQSRSSSA